MTHHFLGVRPADPEQAVFPRMLERNPATHLNFAAGRHGHGNRSELRRIHEAVRGSEVYFV